nr:hypothetical protein [Brevibacillus laterosporus]
MMKGMKQLPSRKRKVLQWNSNRSKQPKISFLPAKSLLFIVDGDNKHLMFYSEDGKNDGKAPIEYPESVEWNKLLKKYLISKRGSIL